MSVSSLNVFLTELVNKMGPVLFKMVARGFSLGFTFERDTRLSMHVFITGQPFLEPITALQT